MDKKGQISLSLALWGLTSSLAPVHVEGDGLSPFVDG